MHSDDTAARLQRLVEDLKRRGCIRTAGVEAAFRAIPRHLFVPGVPLDDVYVDKAIPTKRAADGGFISSSSQPAVMALMLEQLGLEPGHRVLEIGAGTGYNAALMSHIVGPTGQVVTMDIDEDLVAGAREHLAAAGFDAVRVVCGDGGLGYPEAAPYDRIVLTVGAWDITPGWREQLKPGGRLLLPLSIKGPQMCVAFEQADGHLQSVSIEECGFMTLRGAFAGPSGWIRVGEITVGVVDPAVVNAVEIAEWLNTRSQDRPTGIRVKAGNVFASLSHWLSFRESGYCTVIAEGDAADRGIIPDLFRWSPVSTVRQVSTHGVVGARGVCLFMRPSDAPPGAEGDPPWRQPFDLCVRTFGTDDALAERVIEHVKAWDAAGRPHPKELRIRAYPKDAGYRPSEGELVVDKRWSRLVLNWPRGG
ncbi:MAG: methyltransferase, FxLD system [bacterium]